MDVLCTLIFILSVWIMFRAMHEPRSSKSGMSVAEETTLLKPSHYMYGAQWCHFTREQWKTLSGKDFDADSYAKDPQVVQCDKEHVLDALTDGVKTDIKKKLCTTVGYPTVVSENHLCKHLEEKGIVVGDCDKYAAGQSDEQLHPVLEEWAKISGDSKGLWVGFDKAKVDKFALTGAVSAVT